MKKKNEYKQLKVKIYLDVLEKYPESIDSKYSDYVLYRLLRRLGYLL